jgi:osmotically-inducible protein OsmY
MKTGEAMIAKIGLAGFVMATTLAACGGDGPEEKIAELSQKQRDAEERVQEAAKRVRGSAEKVSEERDEAADRRQALEREQRSVAEATREHEQATRRLEQARKRLRDLRREIAREVTDVALFRHIQKSLLEEKSLSDVAIAVQVEEHVVTLSGRVPDAELERTALRLAERTPGVLEVRDRIEVVAAPPAEAPTPAAEPTPSNG